MFPRQLYLIIEQIPLYFLFRLPSYLVQCELKEKIKSIQTLLFTFLDHDY